MVILFIRNLLVIIVILLALNIILPMLSNPPISYAAKNIEYKIIDLEELEGPRTTENIEKLCNEYGKEGWEYISHFANCFIFKRETKVIVIIAIRWRWAFDFAAT